MLATIVASQASIETFFGIRSKPIKDQKGRLSNRDHIISRAIAINYYKAMLKQLLSVPKKQLVLQYQNKSLSISEIQFDILLPRAESKSFFYIQKALKRTLHKGIIEIDGKEEIFIDFRFTDEKNGKIQIVDSPFLILNCLELHLTQVKEICQLDEEGIALQPLSYNYPREAHSFMQTLFYLMNTDHLPTENIHFRRF
ncbi:MAG: hypothetical protein AAFY45_10580 [Bacteroidota bacterium]